MKTTYNWLKDFVEIALAPQTLAEKLTMAGLEVISLEKRGEDFVFEIEVTSNRPDWLSVVGIAREVAAITGSRLRAYSVERIAYSKSLSAKRYPCLSGRQALNAKILKIEIEDKKDCPLYTAKIIQGVQVKPSPVWLKSRLEAIGCRSVNNIVDITNYVMFAYGEPLHAFDLDKLGEEVKIVVRRAKSGEKITTIDGIERVLDGNILVIADEKKPVAVAGIMGGVDTQVTESTKNILLEAAVFNPVIVRRGRQALRLQSESAYRFERGVDFYRAQEASLEAAALIEKLAGGRGVLAKKTGESLARRKNISLALESVEKILGVGIPVGKIKQILTGLGCKIKKAGKNKLNVEIPAQRQDLISGIDLIEELARIFGYARIPASVPAVMPQVTFSKARDFVSLIKDILLGLGLDEVITYSLVSKELLSVFKQGESIAPEILNPLSKEQEVLRPTLIPSLCVCLAFNINQKQEYAHIFEVAKVFGKKSSVALPEEKLVLGIALGGVKPIFLEQGAARDKLGALHLKGILEVLFKRLGVREYKFAAQDSACSAVYAGKELVGYLMILPQEAVERFGIKNKEVAGAELFLEKLLSIAQLQKKFTPLPLYPGIARDISLVVKEGISAQDLLDFVQVQGSLLLKEAKVIDYYKGRHISPGFKGFTLSCLYRADERTLTDAEVNPVHAAVLNSLIKEFSAQIR